MEEIDQCCASLCMSCLKWDEPTHYKGRCIDHIFCQVAGLVEEDCWEKKRKCKLHSMARAGNVKNKVSHMFIYEQVSSTHLTMWHQVQKQRTHTNKSTRKRHKDTTSLRKGTTDDVSTNKFTGWKIRIWRINYAINWVWNRAKIFLKAQFNDWSISRCVVVRFRWD